MKYENELSALSERRGGRNRELVRIALLGFGAGKSAQEIADDIMDNCGEPRLEAREVRRAVEYAQAVKVDRNDAGGAIVIDVRRAQATGSTASEEERGFVKSFLDGADDATSRDLMGLSPVAVHGLSPREQAMLFCATIWPDDRWEAFTCDERTLMKKRGRDSVRPPSVIFHSLKTSAPPTFCIANQFTGKADRPPLGDDFDNFRDDPEASFANAKCLATRRLTVVEFDDMALADQCRFWTKAIKCGLCPGLRTLTFSGGKSIHALVRVESEELRCVGNDAEGWPKFGYGRDPATVFRNARAEIERRLASSGERRYRMDPATKDPTRVTRFAGGVRERDGKKIVQRLLWCSGPMADDVPPDPDGGRFECADYGAGGIYEN